MPSKSDIGSRSIFVVLSGDEESFGASLRQMAGSREVEILSKNELRPRAIFSTLRRLWSRPIDTFSYFTISAAWQQRRVLLLLISLAAGARRAVILDGQESSTYSWNRIIFREVPRTVVEIVTAPLLLLLDNVARTVIDGLCSSGALPPAAYTRGLGSCETWLYVLQVPASVRLESGTSSHVRGVLEALIETGRDVRVVSYGELPAMSTCHRRTEVAWPPIAWFGLFPRLRERFNNLVWLIRLWRATGQARPDVVYQRHARHAWAAAAVARLRGIPFVLEFNESEVRAGVGWNGLARTSDVRRSESFCLRHATVVGYISDELSELTGNGGRTARRTIVNPNGVDLEHFGSSEAELDGQRLRRRLGFDTCVVVSFVGTFMPYHGSEVLADAVRLLGSEENVRFLFVGDGCQRTSTARALEAEVGTDRVTFAGRVAYAELPAYLAASDICVAPYVPVPAGAVFVNSPIKILEYMAAGRATIASDLGQIRRMLGNGAGVLVPPGDADILADAIRRLASDAATRAELGAAARREVQQYSWRRHVERVLEALEGI